MRLTWNATSYGGFVYCCDQGRLVIVVLLHSVFFKCLVILISDRFDSFVGLSCCNSSYYFVYVFFRCSNVILGICGLALLVSLHYVCVWR